MLLIDDLERFCEAFKAENSEIKKVLFLVDDNDYVKFVKQEAHQRDEAILITVLPSVNIQYTDNDNMGYKNFLHFFIIQKENAKSSYNSYLNTFKFTQPLMLKLFKFIYQKTSNYKECIFKDFDLAHAGIDPVTDKVRTYGYSLSIPLNTKFS